MRELCTKEEIILRTAEGGEWKLPVFRYREFAVGHTPSGIRILLVPAAAYLCDADFITIDRAIACMIEIDKLKNNWLGLEDTEWEEVWPAIFEILQRYARPFIVEDTPVVSLPEDANGYGSLN